MLFGAYALIVEDEYLIALEVQRVLEEAGARAPYIARSTDEAVRVISDQRFDIALVSLGPDITESCSLCMGLREAGMAVVALSADGAHRAGVDGLDGIGIVTKPFTDEEVIAATTAALLSVAKPPADEDA